eukprot:scaffold56539_cov67-Phaeocystis_antarctica.AAC.1
MRAARSRLGLKPENLAKLNGLPLVMGSVGVVTLLTMWVAVATPGWIQGTALYEGELIDAQLSLTHVVFGAGSLRFCGAAQCPLRYMCHNYEATLPHTLSQGQWRQPPSPPPPRSPPTELNAPTTAQPSAQLPFTTRGTWCDANRAGRRTLALLWFGTVVGLAASGLTLLYAARRTDAVGRRLARLEAAGLSGAHQRRLLALCWGGYWASLFGALAWYAAASPRSLGWGGSALQAPFGLLRLCLLLASGCLAGALLSHDNEAVFQVWAKAISAEPRSVNRALHRLMGLQAGLYLLHSVAAVDLSLLLLVFAYHYLDDPQHGQAKNNLLLLYLAPLGMSLILDLLHLAATPELRAMSIAEAIGFVVHLAIVTLKLAIAAALRRVQTHEGE